MKWSIVVDSSCDMTQWDDPIENVRFARVPFVISVDKWEYTDDEGLDTAEMLDAMDACPTASHTACPSPEAWYAQFMQAEQSVAITISGALSGSYNAALTAKTMVLENCPEKKIHIVDSRSAGPGLAMILERILSSIRAGQSFEATVAACEECAQKTHVLFALSSFENLTKNGRIPRLVGLIAGKLGMRVIGLGSAEGKIELIHKIRGVNRTIGLLFEEMKRKGYSGGRVIISHCQNLPLASTLCETIRQGFSDAEIAIMATRGLCSYYAERFGLIVAF